MASWEPRRRPQRSCCIRCCFLLRPQCSFATSVLWCDWWPFCSWKLMQQASIARDGCRTRVLQPWTATEARYTASLPTSFAATDRRHRSCNPVVYAAASVDPVRNARGDEDGAAAGGSEAASAGGKQGQRWSKTRAAWVWDCVRDPASGGGGASFFSSFFRGGG